MQRMTYCEGAILSLAHSLTHSLTHSPTPLLYMGLINKVDMVCLSPVGYGV